MDSGNLDLINMIISTGEAYNSPVGWVEDIPELITALEAHGQFASVKLLGRYYTRMGLYAESEFDLSINVKEYYAADA